MASLSCWLSPGFGVIFDAGAARKTDLSLISELKRRHVFRVAITCFVVARLILQVADAILDKIGVPDWPFKVLLAFPAPGFAVTILPADARNNRAETYRCPK